jgi:hypothetical protein
MVVNREGPVNLGAVMPAALGKLRRVSAIPTLWRGIQFRSRLEARWAAFFTELKLPWEYEPTDLEWYIPDFIINFKRRRLLVEIKPAQEDLEYAKHKLKHSGWEGDSLIAISGQSREWGVMLDGDTPWDTAMLGYCLKCKTPTLVSSGGRWECRSCDGSNRDIWWAYDCSEAWNVAGSTTQWRSPA